MSQRIRHDPLLDDVGGIARQPEDLRGEAASPEVDGWGGEGGVVGEVLGEDVVGAPPEEEEAAEDESRAETVI